MAEVIGNDRNDFHGSTIKDKDLQQKLTTPKFEPIFKFNMLLAILDGSHYRNYNLPTQETEVSLTSQ